MNDQKTYLTKAGLDKLQAELEDLKSTKRPQVLAKIKEAVSYGDLSENSEYEDAKNEQGFVEGRIAELEHILTTSEVVKGGSGNGTVALGSQVTVKQNDSQQTFTIVGPAEADPGSGMVSNESPIGRALLGTKQGDSVDVQTPKGSAAYQILKVS